MEAIHGKGGIYMMDAILLMILVVAAVVFVPILPKLVSGIGYRKSLVSGSRALRPAGTIGDFYSDFDTDIESGIDPQIESAHRTVSLEGLGCRIYTENESR